MTAALTVILSTAKDLLPRLRRPYILLFARHSPTLKPVPTRSQPTKAAPTPANLRRELAARNLDRATAHPHEHTSGPTPSVLYTPDPATNTHGNFLDSSFRRIQANPAWVARLSKAYTSSRRIPGRRFLADDLPTHTRRELDCANSSDALLMNILCYPGLLARPAVQHLLGLDHTAIPNFGVAIGVPLHPSPAQLKKRNAPAFHPDRTEIDCRLADLLLEAKLTETGFQTAPARLVTRYRDLDEVFDVDELPRHPATGAFLSYQLLRGVLAAHANSCRFAVLCDSRRPDLAEAWFQVLRAVRSFTLRSRLQLLTWQELARTCPPPVRRFLSTKYGILSA